MGLDAVERALALGALPAVLAHGDPGAVDAVLPEREGVVPGGPVPGHHCVVTAPGARSQGPVASAVKWASTWRSR